MKKALTGLGLLLFSLLIIWFICDRLFSQGMQAGTTMMEEFAVLDYSHSLETLNGNPSLDSYKRGLIQKMNLDLYSLSSADRNLSIHPPTLRILLSLNSSRNKASFAKLRDERKKNCWQSDNAEQEKQISAVINRYAEFGNPYGL